MTWYTGHGNRLSAVVYKQAPDRYHAEIRRDKPMPLSGMQVEEVLHSKDGECQSAFSERVIAFIRSRP